MDFCFLWYFDDGESALERCSLRLLDECLSNIEIWKGTYERGWVSELISKTGNVKTSAMRYEILLC